jgi:transcriptional regulator with XRE-family HTH domain
MIGNALKIIRVFKNIKAFDLAVKLGISPSYLSEIETGKKLPPLELIHKYADIFKVKPSSILFFSEELDSNGVIRISQESLAKKYIRNKLFTFLQSVEHAGT